MVPRWVPFAGLGRCAAAESPESADERRPLAAADRTAGPVEHTELLAVNGCTALPVVGLRRGPEGGAGSTHREKGVAAAHGHTVGPVGRSTAAAVHKTQIGVEGTKEPASAAGRIAAAAGTFIVIFFYFLFAKKSWRTYSAQKIKFKETLVLSDSHNF